MKFARVLILAPALALLLSVPCRPETPSDELQRKIMDKQGIDQATLERFLPFIIPPVDGPVCEGLDIRPVSFPGNQALADLGAIDVTAPPFRADPTGTRDSTRALQDAIDFARNRQMAAYLPAGKYRISDSITSIQGMRSRENGRLTSAIYHPTTIIGSTADPAKRSVLYLAPRSPGFTDPDRKKIVVHILKHAYDKGYGNYDSGESMNQVFRSVDIVIGEGNHGAIGIRMCAAEGSTIQDVTIDATHGHTGMRGAAGGGGSHHALTIIGGRVGIDTQGWEPEFRDDGIGTQVTPTLAGITLVGQTEAALIQKSRGPLVGVGWKIVFHGKGPAIINHANSPRNPFDGGLCLIDSTIECKQPVPAIISAERSFFLENVFIKNAAAVCDKEPVAHPGVWTRLVTFALARNPESEGGYKLNEYPSIDGLAGAQRFVRTAMENPPNDLMSRHIWDRSSFPSWDSSKAVNVRAAPYRARGNGRDDDTRALQKAIDEHEIVFLPKGYYFVSDTLRLRPSTKLVGLHHSLSIIMTANPFGNLIAGPGPKPIVETADAPDAETVISFIGIHVPNHVETANFSGASWPIYALKWRSGGRSVVRSPNIARINITGHGMKLPAGYAEIPFREPLVQITGNGGGRWYNFFVHGAHRSDERYRHILIQDTVNDLNFYHLHAQHAPVPFQIEAKNARSVSIYGSKTENDFSFLRATDCGSFSLYGYGGIATPPAGGEHFIFENVGKLLLACINDQVNLGPTTVSKQHNRRRSNIEDFRPFVDRYNNRETAPPGLARPVLYLRTNAR